jgi:hypothetical protein
MLRTGSVAQLVEQRPFKALVPGSSPGRPKPSKVAFYLRKSPIYCSRNETHQNARKHRLFGKYSSTTFSQERQEVVLKELFEPQAARLFAELRRFGANFDRP